MPLEFPSAPNSKAQDFVCPKCDRASTGCLLDLRKNPIPGRNTTFRIAQDNLIACTFSDFVPGCEGDPDSNRSFEFYRTRAKENFERAGEINFSATEDAEAFTPKDISGPAWGKVAGDMYEILEAAALWNAAAAWNQYMDSGQWPTNSSFTKPADSIATPLRRVAIVKLPRGYDSTKLLTPAARASYEAFQLALNKKGMQLKLSSPDIVGLRIPDPAPEGYDTFLTALPNLAAKNLAKLTTAHSSIEGTIEGRNFLFAIAVKTSSRSDRLYQPLFEANVLKFLVSYVLKGSILKFHVHQESFEGANVAGAYTAASLSSLMLGGNFQRAVDHLYKAEFPKQTAQEILDSLVEYAI